MDEAIDNVNYVAAVANIALIQLNPPAAGGGAVVVDNAVDIALQWIRFERVDVRNLLRLEGFQTFEDLANMKDKDIRDLAESYGRRTGPSRMDVSYLACVAFNA